MTSLRKWTNKLKYLRKETPYFKYLLWAGSNFGSLAILITGWYFKIPFIEFIGILIFSALNVMAGILWLYFYLVADGTIDVIYWDSAAGESKPEGVKGNIEYDLEHLRDIVNSTLPDWADQAYDLIVAGVMIYIGYTWLPFFYLLHIVFLAKIKKAANDILIAQAATREAYSESLRAAEEATTTEG